jgi:hypothetical protein
MKKYKTLITGLIVVWFILVLSASGLHLFTNGTNSIGIAVATAAVAPIAIFFLWFSSSDSFRRFAMTLDPATLTSLHSWRILGFSFVVLEARGILPAIFAWPAGYGDMAIGATAAFVAWKFATPSHRGTFLLWQMLGILDLIVAVALGTTARLTDPHGVSMAAMTVLPLSLVPTFLVPLFLILHAICIAQAKGWRGSSEHFGANAIPANHSAC